ncbi:hypothetical protein ACFYMW_30165 [Streptomyces sp. NPDC006692]|uniref:hypothetical protein n=1 Tax=Streptomyces sp. NPDC006692 TaxID=3364758 RepID=UPI0036B759D6
MTALPRSPDPSPEAGGEGPALLFLAGDPPGQDVAVDVRVDGGEDQALKFGRLQGLHLPLHYAAILRTLP